MPSVNSRLQKFTESVTLDVLGVLIVVSASIAMGYHLTVIDGIPIGILSTVGEIGRAHV